MDLHGSAIISSLGSTMLLTVAKEATGQTWNFVSRLAGESLKHGQTPTAPGRGASVAVGSVCTVRIGGSSTCPKGWGERGTDGWMVWIGLVWYLSIVSFSPISPKENRGPFGLKRKWVVLLVWDPFSNHGAAVEKSNHFGRQVHQVWHRPCRQFWQAWSWPLARLFPRAASRCMGMHGVEWPKYLERWEMVDFDSWFLLIKVSGIFWDYVYFSCTMYLSFVSRID